jgi:hypothetical protein
MIVQRVAVTRGCGNIAKKTGVMLVEIYLVDDLVTACTFSARGSSK